MLASVLIPPIRTFDKMQLQLQATPSGLDISGHSNSQNQLLLQNPEGESNSDILSGPAREPTVKEKLQAEIDHIELEIASLKIVAGI
jgi:hypothetical protein